MDAERINKTITVLSFLVFRAVALSSLVAHLLLVFLSDFRRRKASGVRRFFLWFAYQVNNWAPPYLIGNLYLETTPRDKQLFAFWVPFLLLHLARPDNMSAYTMEDNALSGRVLLVLPWQCVGAFLVVLRYIQIDSTAGTMRPASWIMLILGIFKYVESYFALKGGDLGNIRSSFKQASSLSLSDSLGVYEKPLEDEEALLVAHDLFDICKAAFSDRGVDITGRARDTRGAKGFVRKNMCKVVEMELSLMYDLMYTKAAMVHTRPGYFIRVVSPPLTAAAFTLFWFRYRDQMAGNRDDVVITFILMGTTLVLDVRWLLKAVVSTWAYAFFKGTKWEHAVFCSGRWRRLRHLLVSLDPSRLSVKELKVKTPSSYRMWSLTIGQHNLLRDFHDSKRLCSRLARSIGLEESWNERCYSRVRGLKFSPDKTVRDDLFQRIWSTVCKDQEEELKKEKEAEEKKKKEGQPQEEHKARIKLDENLGFDPELEEVVLIWHIATDVFLLSCTNQEDDADAGSRRRTRKVIKAVSNYMMFLIAVRPGMLPGLKFRSVYETTHGALNKIWQRATWDGSHTSCRELACILRQKLQEDTLHKWSFVLSDGTRCAMLMLKRLKTRLSTPTEPEPKLEKKLERWRPELFEPQVLDMPRMLDLIFTVWVRLLIYASIRSSRDSHAKQLGQGGELTTVVWILIQHTRLFTKPSE